MDLTLYKNQLKKILEALDKEIDNQFKETNESNMKFDEIKKILGRIDGQIINKPIIREALAAKEVETRQEIQEMIKQINQDVKQRIDRLKDNLSNDGKKRELGKIYQQDVAKNETNTTLNRLNEIDEGKFQRQDYEVRLEEAKKEFKNAEKVDKEQKNYNTLKTDTKKTDQDLQDEFKIFQTESNSWRDKIDKLEKIAKYDYMKNLDEVIDLANSKLDVDEELANKINDLRKHMNYLKDTHVQVIAINKIDKDPKKDDIMKIRAELAVIQNSPLNELNEIKNNKKEIENANTYYYNEINKLNVLKVFRSDIDKITSAIEDDKKPLADKWQLVNEFMKRGPKILKDFEKGNAHTRYLEAALRLNNLDREKEIQEKVVAQPVVPVVVDTQKLDLTDLGLR